ncbi:hypothetical protein HMPREF9140_00880 [Prevotella micans F0438]|uniref:Uncharacterized protein n=1 Tax=Prevotella micans F0438 TaxID=883158 RepID=H1Q1U2_9BACT|nr:hypothetical protein HMPREF9140_00880 [Prevotella micans F0438]
MNVIAGTQRSEVSKNSIRTTKLTANISSLIQNQYIRTDFNDP